ncbi:hypothetical protein [Chryseobacterium viscerum]|uniref:Uncharacterized protein n=1 Tax=Chryseobacterium viscerum TaxID=1037377 RepID=A0A316WZR6_9FLAO|nr:hypothetical protein [Chryseobacterium viscerum]PWN64120.1 hypothetical protein C1634_005875 [Chryseobacterium viscerum]
MKTINVKLYPFSELEKEVREKVLERFRYCNTHHDWWETEYDDFVSICSLLGITTSPQEIFFSGFWSQGDGSTFASKVDIQQFTKGITQESWRKHAPTLKLNFPPFSFGKRMLNLIESGDIEISIWTEAPNKGYWVKYHSKNELTNHSKTYPNIEQELEKLEDWAEQSMKILNTYLYENLRNSYEYLICDKAVQETIEDNDYLFTANGEHADWLIKLTASNTLKF